MKNEARMLEGTKQMTAKMLSRAVLATLGLSLSATGAGAQHVQYYHLDAIGNVRVVTDPNRNVVERHDYLPFGEECTTGPCSGNTAPGAGQPKKFTGKERDRETGLDYFGGRYYGSRIARFTTVDPALNITASLLDPQRWNRYAYALNNPLRYIDPNGRWPTKPQLPVHQNSVDRALSSLPAGDREVLKSQQAAADAPEFQSSEFAYRHAMRGPNQSAEEAHGLADDYVRSEIETAQQWEQLAAHANALAHLGNAMHTLQDATSPAHEGFQEWRTEWSSYLSRDAQKHFLKERHDPGANSRLDQATRDAWEYFTGSKSMPQDFFHRDEPR